jgi:hypothetical protein
MVPDHHPEARELLNNLKRDRGSLAALLDRTADEWVYEDLIYRFWHQSFKVYYLHRGDAGSGTAGSLSRWP